jgi:peptidoglycan/LPS O-acetylase OafA/YrhL
MISGYVIALSAEERTRTQFVHARFVRLWPAFVMCLTMTVIAQGISGNPPGLAALLGNLTMVPHLLGISYADPVYWSLMFEILFYCGIATFVISEAGFISRLRNFTIVWLAFALLGQYVDLPKIKVVLVLDYAPFFAVGASIYLVRNYASNSTDRLLFGCSTIIAMIFAMKQSAIRSPVLSHPYPWICAVIIAGSAGLVYVGTMAKLGPRAEKLSYALGGISYPLYLLHGGLGSVFARWAAAKVGAFSIVIAIGAILGLSWVVWRIEIPVRQRLQTGRSSSRRSPTRTVQPS